MCANVRDETTGQGMREDWDARARTDAMHYIATSSPPGQWESERFYSEGRSQARDLVEPACERLGFDPRGKRLLDIGCGIGRLFPGFRALGFEEIWGVDVSPEMIARARRLCPVADAHFVVGTGWDLAGIESDYFDYCFSYIVFQHVPDRTVVWEYLDEVYRVLRRNGVFQLHLRGSYPLKQRLGLLLPPGVFPIVQSLYRLTTLRWLRGQPIKPAPVPGSRKTWLGVTVPAEQAAARLSGIGFSDVEIVPDRSYEPGTRYWAIGRKP